MLEIISILKNKGILYFLLILNLIILFMIFFTLKDDRKQLEKQQQRRNHLYVMPCFVLNRDWSFVKRKNGR